MNTPNFSDKMKDPLFKKHFTFSIIYLLLSLLILTGGVEYLNSYSTPFKNVRDKDIIAKQKLDDAAKAIETQRVEAEAAAKANEQAKINLKKDIAEITPKLKIDTLTEGTGDAVEVGDNALVHYTGTNSKGEVFDTSLDGTRPPFEVQNVGLGQVIKGWNIGLIGMKKGGKYKLFIPSEFAYGDKSPSAKIGANENLTFEMTIVEVDKTKNQVKN